jgi:DNA-directed RNA polymerase subunit beta
LLNNFFFSRSGIRKDKRYKEEVIKQIAQLEKDFEQHHKELLDMSAQKIIGLIAGTKPQGKVPATILTKGAFDAEKLVELEREKVLVLKSADKKIAEEIKNIVSSYEVQDRVLEGLKEEKINKLKKGDPLPSGVIKMVKVFIAHKRHISVGDKIAGRHGNKGVISNIVPREDMPYLDDGTAVDVVLNPLGIPSRMNVGQILETTLGFVGRKMGDRLQTMIEEKSQSYVKEFLEKSFGADFVKEFEKKHGKDGLAELARKTAEKGLHFAVPVFEGPHFDADIRPMLKDLGLSETGTFKLNDGRTGEPFDQPVAVGCMYMMKLDHMVDDKLHARSVGPYSLITQQPLGGKAQGGGQRLGEMEVWALQAYGASYTLQEMLTYKSDDVTGRHKVYESIVRGDDISDPGLPESFNVLIKELQSLGLQIDLCKVGKEEASE